MIILIFFIMLLIYFVGVECKTLPATSIFIDPLAAAKNESISERVVSRNLKPFKWSISVD